MSRSGQLSRAGYGGQHQIVEIPAISFETLKNVTTFAEGVLDGTLHVKLQCGVSEVEKIAADRGGLTDK
jgi:hypothetical protein